METVGSIISGLMIMMIIFAIVIASIILPIAFIIIKAQNRKKVPDKRKLIEKEERIVLIYEIRKNDPDFNANEIEQSIKHHLNKLYPQLFFRTSDFKIISYNKNENVAKIIYSALGIDSNTNKTEYAVTLEMNIQDSKFMSEKTKSCSNCGAVIENDKQKTCPYCGHTYEFLKYNKWKVKEVNEI